MIKQRIVNSRRNILWRLRLTALISRQRQLLLRDDCYKGIAIAEDPRHPVLTIITQSWIHIQKTSPLNKVSFLMDSTLLVTQLGTRTFKEDLLWTESATFNRVLLITQILIWLDQIRVSKRNWITLVARLTAEIERASSRPYWVNKGTILTKSFWITLRQVSLRSITCHPLWKSKHKKFHKIRSVRKILILLYHQKITRRKKRIPKSKAMRVKWCSQRLTCLTIKVPMSFTYMVNSHNQTYIMSQSNSKDLLMQWTDRA